MEYYKFLETVQVTDKVLLENGEIVTVEEIDILDGFFMYYDDNYKEVWVDACEVMEEVLW